MNFKSNETIEGEKNNTKTSIHFQIIEDDSCCEEVFIDAYQMR